MLFMKQTFCLLLTWTILLTVFGSCTSKKGDESASESPSENQIDFISPGEVSAVRHSYDEATSMITLFWINPDDEDFIHTRIEWDDAANPLIALGSPSLESSHTFAIDPAKGYNFRLISVDENDLESQPHSHRVDAFNPENQVDFISPGEVSAVRHSYDEATSMITLFWINPDDEDFIHARIEWNGAANPLIALGSPGLESSHTFAIDLAKGYNFRLISVDENDLESQPYSHRVNAFDPPPGVVGGLLLRPQDGTAFLSWTDPIDSDLERIEITWSDGMNTPLSATVAVGVQTFMATGLTNGQEYTFTVSTYDARGTKSSTAPLSVTPQISSSPLDPPSGITITQDQEFRLRLRWTNPDHPELASINITLNGMFIENITGLSPNSVSNYTLELPYPTSEMSHTVRLKAVDTRGNGSPTLTFRGLDPINCEESNNCQIEVGQPALKGLIEKEADRDIYAVELVSGTKYRIQMERIAALPVGNTFSGLDPMLRIYHNSAHGSFIANNNGSTLTATPGDDAELWYEAERDGTHYIEATPGTVISDNGVRNYTGTYRLLIEQDTGSNPIWADQLPRDGSTGLSQPARNYELVWNEEFNTHPNDSPWWDKKVVFTPTVPSGTFCCSIGKPNSKHPIQTDFKAFYMWTTNIRPAIDVNGGSLELGVAYPNYTGSSEFSGHLDSVERGWRLPNGVLMYNGEIPAFSSDSSYNGGWFTESDLGYVVDGLPGYWVGLVSTIKHFESRYGYFEVEADYSDMNGFYRFFGNWWLRIHDSYLGGGYELDVAETIAAPDKRRDFIRRHFRIHLPNASGYRKTHFDHNLRATNGKVIFGFEWTPQDYCLFHDRVKIGCASTFPNGSSFHEPFSVLEQPLPHIFNTEAKGWLGGRDQNPFDHHERLGEDLESGGDGTVKVKFNYLRVYKPQNRYGDRNPDNHIYKRPISNKNELVVLPTD